MNKPAVIRSNRIGSVLVLRFDRPPANATGLALRRALAYELGAAAGDKAVQALVLTGTGRFFSAGADIGELGTPDNQREPRIRTVIDALESSAKPIVAAINGIAFGGGLELALGCSHRVAAQHARLALPEVKLGLIPGAGGTQRLPRLVGLAAAIELILGGEPVDAVRAREIGLVDAVLGEPFVENAAMFAAQAATMAARQPVRSRVCDSQNTDKILASAGDGIAASGARGRAPRAALRCLEASIGKAFDEGMQLEYELVLALIESPEAKELRKEFFASRAGTKNC
jgi:3-hydroxyacyl-CoA dehydrogenase